MEGPGKRQMGEETSAEKALGGGGLKEAGEQAQRRRRRVRRAVGDPADISGSAPRDVTISQILLINDTFTWVPALLLNTNWSILRANGETPFPTSAAADAEGARARGKRRRARSYYTKSAADCGT